MYGGRGKMGKKREEVRAEKKSIKEEDYPGAWINITP